MSYDLMVFDKASAPKTKAEFMTWYDHQTEWTEGHSYDDPAITSESLRNWFFEMIKVFPALNGPYSVDEESDRTTDYCIGRDVIYAAFAWSMTAPAYKTMYELAQKHQVGFFDASGTGEIFFPVNGTLTSIVNQTKKAWWKFWL